jgi:hypothetical protein
MSSPQLQHRDPRCLFWIRATLGDLLKRLEWRKNQVVKRARYITGLLVLANLESSALDGEQVWSGFTMALGRHHLDTRVLLVGRHRMLIENLLSPNLQVYVLIVEEYEGPALKKTRMALAECPHGVLDK